MICLLFGIAAEPTIRKMLLIVAQGILLLCPMKILNDHQKWFVGMGNQWGYETRNHLLNVMGINWNKNWTREMMNSNSEEKTGKDVVSSS